MGKRPYAVNPISRILFSISPWFADRRSLLRNPPLKPFDCVICSGLGSGFGAGSGSASRPNMMVVAVSVIEMALSSLLSLLSSSLLSSLFASASSLDVLSVAAVVVLSAAAVVFAAAEVVFAAAEVAFAAAVLAAAAAVVALLALFSTPNDWAFSDSASKAAAAPVPLFGSLLYTAKPCPHALAADTADATMKRDNPVLPVVGMYAVAKGVAIASVATSKDDLPTIMFELLSRSGLGL